MNNQGPVIIFLQLPPASDSISIADFDFTLCQRMKKLTTHDLFKVKLQNVSYVVKLFPKKCQVNYEQELSYLRRIDHKNISKIVTNRNVVNEASFDLVERSHIIVVKEATRGDLNEYLPRYGKFSQKAARTLFSQIIDALMSAANCQLQGIIHPNLLASSILLDDDGRVQICGWSEINNKQLITKTRDCIFACGEILICLVTTFMPFYKKYSPTDTFYKFIHPDHIHKFWNEFQKKITKIDKKFQFSSEFKELVQAIFFKKILSLQEILQSKWFKNPDIYSQDEMKQILSENEKVKGQKLVAKKMQEASSEQKRRRILHNYQISYGMTRSVGSSQQHFIHDYEDKFIKQQELPKVECLPFIRIEDANPNFIIASLKEFFRSQNGKVSIMLCEQFILNNHKVVKVNNYALIELDFELNLLEDDDDQPIHTDLVTLKLKLSFMRNSNKQLYADFEVIQTNFNAYYTNLALKFLEEHIQKKMEVCTKSESS